MTPVPNSGATPESVWAMFQETNKTLDRITQKQAETDRILTEKFAETDRFLTEKFAETDRLQKETDRIIKENAEERKKSQEDFDRRMRKVNEAMGNWANNFGEITEEYFYNSFEKGQKNFFGENFDRIRKNVKPLDYIIEDEYDIILINGKSVGIIEVKHKAHENDVDKVLKKAETFRVNFPEYKNHKVYLGLASMCFYPELEQECIKKGIAIIK
jgi:hypothetical protein